MPDEQTLADLCTICHANPIKYTCPRCGTHTCSLPCVKKHKSRAQCSGIRNPAEYRKRAELATPSSIDKDFNFITSVERSITKADSSALDRGINLAPAQSIHNVKKKPRIDDEIDLRGIKLIRAPKGLSRSKQNKTNWNAQYGTITWTVEWICADGEKVMSSAPESRTLEEAYLLAIGKKKAQKKRKLSEHDQTTANTASKSLKQSQEMSPQNSSSGVIRSSDKNLVANPVAGNMHFYLHHPLTISKYKCVVPVLSSRPIKDALQGRTLLEHPTIYALYTAAEDLEEPYITYDEYEAKHGADIALNLTSHLEDGEVEDVSSVPVAGMDPEKIVEVLAQDIGT